LRNDRQKQQSKAGQGVNQAMMAPGSKDLLPGNHQESTDCPGEYPDFAAPSCLNKGAGNGNSKQAY
jgi:hypothetical protein